MRCGTPVSMTFIASLIAAGSTQPPEMEPRTLPSSFTARAAPGSRGADRSVAMRVTRATFFPDTRTTLPSRDIPHLLYRSHVRSAQPDRLRCDVHRHAALGHRPPAGL